MSSSRMILRCSAVFTTCYDKDVGYTHVNIDDCYAEKNRSASGDIVAGSLSAACCLHVILRLLLTARHRSLRFWNEQPHRSNPQPRPVSCLGSVFVPGLLTFHSSKAGIVSITACLREATIDISFPFCAVWRFRLIHMRPLPWLIPE